MKSAVIAWSGAGRIAKVEVSADGGASWRDAPLQGPIFSKSFTRFRLPWEWSGHPGHTAKPRHRRQRQRAADAQRIHRAVHAWHELSQPLHPDLGYRRRREHQQCIRIIKSQAL
jgi:hypothetical protein